MPTLCTSVLETRHDHHSQPDRLRPHPDRFAVALVLFWVPVAARKGSPLHVRAGRYYSTVMYAVSATAFVASVMVLIDPIGIRRPGETATSARKRRSSP